MIAYNHYINFLDKLEDQEKCTACTKNVINVKEGSTFDIDKQLQYRKKYYNNQGRDILFCSDRVFNRTQRGQFWAYEVEKVMIFFWESGSNVVRYIPYEKFSTKLLKYWSLHIVLPIFFTIEETYNFLHAGAVEIDGKPILFVADSFGGKSTLVDFFIKKGHAMISDDKVATFEKDGHFFAVPAYPYHRPYRKMEDLGYFVTNLATDLNPIHVIYELERANKDDSVIINELQGMEKFKALRYSSEFNLSFLKTSQFSFLSSFAKVVRVYRVSVPWDTERLSEVYKTICEHSATVKNIN